MRKWRRGFGKERNGMRKTDKEDYEGIREEDRHKEKETRRRRSVSGKER